MLERSSVMVTDVTVELQGRRHRYNRGVLGLAQPYETFMRGSLNGCPSSFPANAMQTKLDNTGQHRITTDGLDYTNSHGLENHCVR
jgi:hypothetical protein